MWFNDSIWRKAAEACLRWKDEFDWILTPREFHSLHPRFRPLEYSECAPPGRVAFLCNKDFSDNLSPAFRAGADQPGHYLFANEVFVLGSLECMPVEADPELPDHLAAWFNRVSGKLPGRRDRPVFHTEIQGEAENGKKALLIGASGFGNLGDDLLARAAARLLLESGAFASVDLGSFDLRRTDLAAYDEVFVGPGGLLYVSQAGELDWQNLANYFKIPFWCGQYSIPCHLLAVGHQESGLSLGQDGPTRRFLKESLSRFQNITVRDQETAGLIRQISGRASVVGADLVFSHAPEVARAPGPPLDAASGLLLAGEIFHYPAFSEWIQSSDGQSLMRDSGVGFALLSNDDQPHLNRLRSLLDARSLNLQAHDFRGLSAPDIAAILRRYELLVTTRFHGLVLALLAGVPAVVFDHQGGKKDRLVRSVFPELQDRLFLADATFEQLNSLLSVESWNRLPRADAGKVAAHAETVASHAIFHPAPEAKSHHRLPEKKRRDLAGQLLTENGEIKLCWAAAGPGSHGYTNLGDGLSAFMISNLAGLPVKHTNFQEDTVKMVGVGSIGHGAKHGHAVIWGTGCYRPDILINNVRDTTYDVLCVRGNISQQCLESVGIRAPHCYGEPVWLLPSMFHEKVEKKYDLGIISHISDLKTAGPTAPFKDDWVSFEIPDLLKSSITVITTWHTPNLAGMLDKLRLMLSCKRIASRSFHGVVIAETYGIPCLPICSKPGVPAGGFTSDQVKIALLDRRTVEFFNHGQRRPQFFYGQRRGQATDWDNLIKTIDRVWSPIGYDASPMLESFPFDIPVDPTQGAVPIHPSMLTQAF